MSKENVIKARSGLLFDEPFFGTLLISLGLIHDPERVDTMATDGVHLSLIHISEPTRPY